VKYNNATKQTWRGWAWNRVAEKLIPGQKVMVLVGDGSFDLSVGISKGFEVIGVDLQPDNVSKFRSLGGVAILDTIENQLYSFKPDAVIFDYTGGITKDRMRAVSDACRFCSVVVANFLRGRDPLAVSLSRDLRPIVSDGEKHRGRIAAAFTALDLSRRLFEGIDGLDDDRYLYMSDIRQDAIKGDGQKAIEFCMEMLRLHSPCYYSYRSKDSNQQFDSVCMSMPATVVAGVRPTVRADNLKSNRLAAAAKAVATKRREMN
jgi:hypothetical protein